MLITPLIEANAEVSHGRGDRGPVVLSSRIRLARNLADMPFPGWASESQRREVLTKCLDVLSRLKFFADGTALRLDELSALEKQILVERHFISRELMGAKSGSGCIISHDQSCSVMVNEEDHLRIQMVRSGLDLEGLWKSINKVDSAIEDGIDFAFSPDLGYLTACPTNIGTGLRASAMLHLPGLVLSGNMDKVIRMVNQVGIAVRGIFGEGSDASGSIFQISNQQTLGESEEAIIKRLCNVLDAVIEQENNARQKLIEEKPDKVLDKIGRARGILQNGHLLSSEEAMNLLSLMRLAVDLGMLASKWRKIVDRLLVESQPGHMQYQAKAEISPACRDALRARHMREQLADLPTLNFPDDLQSPNK